MECLNCALFSKIFANSVDVTSDELIFLVYFFVDRSVLRYIEKSRLNDRINGTEML